MTSPDSAARTCPTCGLFWTVIPHTYMPARPGVTGTNSRRSRVSVS